MWLPVVSATRGSRTCQFHIILQIVYSCVCVGLGLWGFVRPHLLSVPLILSRILPMRCYFSILNSLFICVSYLHQLNFLIYHHHYWHKLQILNVVALKVIYLVLLEFLITLFVNFNYFSVQIHMTSSNIIATISQMKWVSFCVGKGFPSTFLMFQRISLAREYHKLVSFIKHF